jgi:hypothetical protein
MKYIPCTGSKRTLNLTINEAYMKRRCSCPVCGKVWEVGGERWKGKLKYKCDKKQDYPTVKIPNHKAVQKSSDKCFR